MPFLYKTSFLKRTERDLGAKRYHTNHGSFVLLVKLLFCFFPKEMHEVMPIFF